MQLAPGYLLPMALEIARLLLGVVIMIFHRQIADWILEQEHFIAGRLRVKGLHFPAPPKQSTAHTIYFGLGLFVALLQLGRLYFLSA